MVCLGPLGTGWCCVRECIIHTALAAVNRFKARHAKRSGGTRKDILADQGVMRVTRYSRASKRCAQSASTRVQWHITSDDNNGKTVRQFSSAFLPRAGAVAGGQPRFAPGCPAFQWWSARFGRSVHRASSGISRRAPGMRSTGSLRLAVGLVGCLAVRGSYGQPGGLCQPQVVGCTGGRGPVVFVRACRGVYVGPPVFPIFLHAAPSMPISTTVSVPVACVGGIFCVACCVILPFWQSRFV